jgi:hypothetical protein
MKNTRRQFLKKTSLVLGASTASLSLPGVLSVLGRLEGARLKLVPVPGEFYSKGLLERMQRERFSTVAEALRAVRNPKTAFCRGIPHMNNFRGNLVATVNAHVGPKPNALTGQTGH